VALTRRKKAWFRAAAAPLLAAALFSGLGCASSGATAGAPPQLGFSAGEERLGIAVEAMRVSAQGFMLDFRFRVIDPEKARPIMDRSIKPYLIDEASGAKFLIPSSPKIGPMRQTTRRIERDRSYWLLFGNPGRYVKPGNLVTVVVGDVRLEHIPVQ